MNFIKNGRVYDVMPCADSFNDIHEIKCGQAEEKLEAGGDEKLIFNFIWSYYVIIMFKHKGRYAPKYLA